MYNSLEEKINILVFARYAFHKLAVALLAKIAQINLFHCRIF